MKNEFGISQSKEAPSRFREKSTKELVIKNNETEVCGIVKYIMENNYYYPYLTVDNKDYKIDSESASTVGCTECYIQNDIVKDRKKKPFIKYIQGKPFDRHYPTHLKYKPGKALSAIIKNNIAYVTS